MPEKYFATVMKKTDIGDNDSVFIAESIIAGDLDCKTNILTSTTGEQYQSINDFNENNNSIGYYSNLVEVDKITDVFKGQFSFPAAIQEYETRSKQIVYYIIRTADGGHVMLPIDRAPYLAAINKINENPENYEQAGTVQLKQQGQSEEEYDDSDELDEDPIITATKELVAAVVKGGFSPDELVDISYRLNEQKEEIEAALECVSLQQDALDEDLAEALKTNQAATVPTPTPLTSQKTKLELIDISDLFNKVTRTLIAQDEPARRAIVEISRLDDMDKKEHGILLTGGTGVGKTLLMKLISRYINRPLLIIDSTQLTAPSFVGRSIEQYLWELYETCGKNKELAERAIVYFDEIDKKGSEKKSDSSGQAVLNTLLKFIEGTDYIACKNPQRQTNNNTVKLNTDNMIIVAGGSFLEVYKAEKKNGLGFAAEGQTTSQYKPSTLDFVNKAMMTNEFMGRCNVVIRLNDLNTDSIRSILLESDESALKMQEAVFRKRKTKLTTKDGYIIAIAEKVLDEEIGARGLNKLVIESTWKAYDEICCNPGVYEEVILTEETARDPKKYQLVKRQEMSKQIQD